jgi:hypothetical protein
MKIIYAFSAALLMMASASLTTSPAAAQSAQAPWNPGVGAAPTGLAAPADPSNYTKFPPLRRMADLEKPSTSHEIALLYYKMNGVRPNFEEWIMKDNRYLSAQNNQRAALMMTEKTRLSRNYEELDVKNTTLKMRVQVLASVTRSKLGATILKIAFPGSGAVYFPYTVGGQNIAVIPNGIDIYREIPITPDQATYLQAKLDPSGRTTMVIEIVPVTADNKQQMLLDDTPQWLLLGEIGYIALYNNLMENVWSFQAPGYKRPSAETAAGGQQLLDLKK